MINIVCSGKIKEKYLESLIDDYKQRIEKYHKINIVEIKDENDTTKEAENILKNINSKDYVIACDLNGRKMNSKEFARLIDKAFTQAGTIDFVIGSSDGLADKVKERANVLLSFSDLTMPHGLFRGVLLEQIYRSFKINNNETYHK